MALSFFSVTIRNISYFIAKNEYVRIRDISPHPMVTIPYICFGLLGPALSVASQSETKLIFGSKADGELDQDCCKSKTNSRPRWFESMRFVFRREFNKPLENFP